MRYEESIQQETAQAIEQLAQRCGNRIVIDTDVWSVVTMIGALQLILRHPDLSDTLRYRIDRLVRGVISAIEQMDPFVGKMLLRGFNPAHDAPRTRYYVSVAGDRGEMFRRALGSNIVPVMSPIPVQAVFREGTGPGQIYLLNLSVITPAQREALELELAAKFNADRATIARDLDADGYLPIIADGCTPCAAPSAGGF